MLINDKTKNAIATVMKYRCVFLQMQIDLIAFIDLCGLERADASYGEQTVQSLVYRLI